MKDTVLYSNECNDLDCKHFFKRTKPLSVVAVGKPILFIGLHVFVYYMAVIIEYKLPGVDT